MKHFIFDSVSAFERSDSRNWTGNISEVEFGYSEKMLESPISLRNFSSALFQL